jgi:MoaA/NifB/PqqE/SkfB family radical SAM enzyme
MKQRLNNISETLNEWKKKRSGPARILLDPTDKCNLNCLFCWRNDDNQVKDEIPDKRLLELVEEANSLNVKEWVISGGGDPFARKKLMLELMKKIKKNGMWGQVITNGTLLDEDDIKDIVKIGWDQLQISLDGPRRIHDFLRNKNGTFNKVIATIKLFNKYKKKFNKKRPEIGFNVVLCNKNYKHIRYLIKVAYRLKLNQVWFEMIAPWSEWSKKLMFSEEEKRDMQKYIKNGKALAESYNIWTNIHYYLNQKGDEGKIKKDKFCLAPWFSIKIHPTGAAGPCCSFYRHEPLGNIKNESLNKIWFNNFELLRRKILKNDLPRYCEECTEGQKREIKEIQKLINV